MLPFRVIQLEQCRALQQNGAKPYLLGSAPLTELSSERNFAIQSRRLSGLFSLGDFVAYRSRNTDFWQQKNEPLLQTGCTTSNRFWVKNRSYRKQTIEGCLTGAGTAFREFRSSARLHPNFGLFFAPIPCAKSRGIA
jgi:hypothetical protein